MKSLLILICYPFVIIALPVGFVCGALALGFLAGYAALDKWIEEWQTRKSKL